MEQSDDEDPSALDLDPNETDNVEVVIRTFHDLEATRSLQEYCKPFA